MNIKDKLKLLVNNLKLLALAGFAVIAADIYYRSNALADKEVRLAQAESSLKGANAELSKVRNRELEEQELGQFTLQLMDIVKADLSEARKLMLARSIVKVATDVFQEKEQRKVFVTIVAIESRFKKDAKSPTGPIGLTQVIGSGFPEFMAHCGYDNVKAEDVWETDINLTAGACYFKFLLGRYNGDTHVAQVAYNQGHNSASAATYSKTGDLDAQEPLKYLAKTDRLKSLAEAAMVSEKVRGPLVLKKLDK